ncbi:MAG: polyphosphate glucokinase [Pseudonocardiales bacterium]|nr:MAG: polyphosphate glucokinase [Pseudonocardiales bacterium]
MAASKAPTPRALGIDIGGTGIKGAVVDLDTGQLATERYRVPTPVPSTPQNVSKVIHEMVTRHGWSGPVGAAFPAVIRGGVARSAANVDPSWIGTDVDALFTEVTNCPVTVMNDADAAGVAEVRAGAAKDVPGVVLLLTLGTGIGSALFIDGHLVPNTELGHLELQGVDAETRAAASAREREGLSWKHWASRLQHYLKHLEHVLPPDLFVLGGGVSKTPDKWLPYLHVETPVVIASLRNNAGIVGAAMVAHDEAVAGNSAQTLRPVRNHPARAELD